MSVLVDTSIWSLALRRLRSSLNATELMLVKDWDRLVMDQRAKIIGPIRQEVLSGISEAEKFEVLRQVLNPFRDETILDRDYIDAATLSNRCRSSGVSVSAVDALICAVAIRLGLPIYSTDKDFKQIKRFAAISLYTPESTRRQVH